MKSSPQPFVKSRRKAALSIIFWSAVIAMNCQCTSAETLPPSTNPTSTQLTPPPSLVPSNIPTEGLTENPSFQPTSSPSNKPSSSPSLQPSKQPSSLPSTSPSASPSTSPSASPSTSPSLSPSESPSTSPSISPSLLPSKNPSNNPSFSPSGPPSQIPSSSPSKQPSNDPSSTPSLSPIEKISSTPSNSPSKKPTEFPTNWPSNIPSDISSVPTNSPSKKATKYPTAMPSKFTKDPSSVPTNSPYKEPENPSRVPSKHPSSPPTLSPLKDPTSSPVVNIDPVPPTLKKIGPKTVKGISMTLRGVDPLNPNGVKWYQNQTKAYIESYYNVAETRNRALMYGMVERKGRNINNIGRILDIAREIIQDVEVTIKVKSMDPSYVDPSFDDEKSSGSSLRRQLQAQKQTLVILYDQTLSYRQKDASTILSLADIVQKPFFDVLKRNTYKNDFLKQRNNEYFMNIDTVGIPVVPSDDDDEKDDDDDDDDEKDGGGLDLVLVAGVASGAVIILLLGAIIWYKRRAKPEKWDTNSFKGHDGIEPSGTKSPPSQLQLSKITDEVSTLADPNPKLGVMTSAESLAGYSVAASVDYDYSRAYMGSGDTSTVSCADGTFGSLTRQSSKSGSNTLSSRALTTGQSIFTDDSSFEAHLRNQNKRLKEEVLEIIAPPGKLGVVIDTPDNGAPVVHAIKDSSVIGNELQVGDQLIAVDDEDVQAMTAIKVSKLISKKSNNPSRKLTIIRSTIVDAL